MIDFVFLQLDIANMTDQELEKRVERAVENFMAGYGCCQSVVAAFADLYGLDDTIAKRIAAGFGGGVGRMRMMCGAVSGIVMLVGLDCGQTEGSDREGKSACYKVVQELLAKSKEEIRLITTSESQISVLVTKADFEDAIAAVEKADF